MDNIKPEDEQVIEFKELPKWIKVILSILGAVNIMFSIFIPIAVALMLVKFYSLTGIRTSVIVMLGSLTSLYKAIDVIGIDTIEYIYNKLTWR